MGKIKLLNQYLLIRYCELTILNSCLFENPVQKTDDIQAVARRFYRKLFRHPNPKRWHTKQRFSSTKRAKGYFHTACMYFVRVSFKNVTKYFNRISVQNLLIHWPQTFDHIMIKDQSSMKISEFVEIKVEDLKTDGGITFSDHNSVTARLKRQTFLDE